MSENGFEPITWEVQDGWLNIVKACVEDLKKLGVTQILQVKEKFGGLRIYAGTYPPGASERINQAEKEAWKTCEDCEETKGVETKASRFWIRTLCPECRVHDKAFLKT